MKENRDDKKQNMIMTLVFWCILCSICMATMLVVASQKEIVVADAAQEQTVSTNDLQQAFPGMELKLVEDNSMKRQLRIPLEEGIEAENIVMENRYIDRELLISIQQEDTSFYDQNAIYGDIEWIESGLYEAGDERVILKLTMSDIMEFHSTLENGSLKLEFSRPEELCEQIIVIDPAAGGIGNRDITCRVAQLVQNKISKSDIKVYLAGAEDVEVSVEKRLQLVEAVEADLFLGLGVSGYRTDVSGNAINHNDYGIITYYNGEYYIPYFGSVQWADIVTRKVTIASGNRAIGLLPAEEDSILMQLEVPAAQVNLGFVTNEQEYQLLQQESYQEKLAQGIADAILEVYSNDVKK